MTVVTRSRAMRVLTLREIELVKHLAGDKGYEGAAAAMRMSAGSLRIWMLNIRRKLRMKSNERVVATLVRCRVIR